MCVIPRPDPTERPGPGVIGSVDISLDADSLVSGRRGELAAASPDEFAAEVALHLPKMASLAARLAPHADRDDVVQEALARAWLKRQLFDSQRGSLSSWLMAITADQARRFRRRRLHGFGHFDPLPTDRLLEERVDVERALGRLAARQRLAVDCYYFAGLSVSETAAVMRCAEGTVKSTLADARRVLRPLLEMDHEAR